MTRDRPALAHELTNGTYGTVVVAGVLAATTLDANPSVPATAAYVFATVVVLWLAHAWSASLGHRAAGSPEQEYRFSHALAADRALVLAALPPLLAMVIVRVAGASDEVAINVAIYLCVLILAVAGAAIARRERASPGAQLFAALVSGSLGALLVVLKVLVH